MVSSGDVNLNVAPSVPKAMISKKTLSLLIVSKVFLSSSDKILVNSRIDAECSIIAKKLSYIQL